MSLIFHIHRLLIDHCTRADNVQRAQSQRLRYVRALKRLLAASTLAPRTPLQVWSIGWDKPFFAYNSAARVGPSVERARRSGLFADPSVVGSSDFLRDGQPGWMLQEGIESGDLVGACAVNFRLEGVQAFAEAVPRITEKVNRFHHDWQAGSLSSADLQERAVAIAEDIGGVGRPIGAEDIGVGDRPIGKVRGFGFTTACHLLADLGLPLFKPDIWVCRIVSSLPGVQNEMRRAWRLGNAPVPFDFLESKLIGPRAADAYRRIVQPVMNTLVTETKVLACEEFDLNQAFLRARFVDWTLVHFAISAETDVYGLERRPVDLLCDADGPICPTYVKALARWLRDGQVALEATSSLASAQNRLRKADTPAKRERAERRLASLLTPSAQAQREALEAQALEARTECERTAVAADWQFVVHYPEGFAHNGHAHR